jgi:hypothetical protein
VNIFAGDDAITNNSERRRDRRLSFEACFELHFARELITVTAIDRSSNARANRGRRKGGAHEVRSIRALPDARQISWDLSSSVAGHREDSSLFPFRASLGATRAGTEPAPRRHALAAMELAGFQPRRSGLRLVSESQLPLTVDGGENCRFYPDSCCSL